MCGSWLLARYGVLHVPQSSSSVYWLSRWNGETKRWSYRYVISRSSVDRDFRCFPWPPSWSWDHFASVNAWTGFALCLRRVHARARARVCVCVVCVCAAHHVRWTTLSIIDSLQKITDRKYTSSYNVLKRLSLFAWVRAITFAWNLLLSNTLTDNINQLLCISV